MRVGAPPGALGAGPLVGFRPLSGRSFKMALARTSATTSGLIVFAAIGQGHRAMVGIEHAAFGIFADKARRVFGAVENGANCLR